MNEAGDTLSPLPVDYYHSNFCALLEFVWSRYQALLSEREQSFYQRFTQQPLPAQKLYIRLLTRKRDCFRASKLSYPELGPLHEAAVSLSGTGLLAINPRLELEALLALFTKTELIQASGQGGLKSLKREALMQVLLAADDSQTIESALLEEENIYQVLEADCFDTFKLCFFGNLRQDMTDYVLRDLGLQVYEDYSLDLDHLPFRSRAQIEQHLHYYSCLDQMDEVLQGEAATILAFADSLPELSQSDATLARRVERCRLSLARQLERIDALDEALALYQTCSRPPARERRARILVKQNEIEPALNLCREILQDDTEGLMIGVHTSEEEQVFAADFSWRVAKKHLSKSALQNWQAPEKYAPPNDCTTLSRGERTVEHLAVDYLQDQGECFYVENSLSTGVFGLYFWDIIFAAIPGAFYNPFQYAPSDFSTPDFIDQRKSLILKRLEELCEEDLHERIWQFWREKQGRANPLVHWSGLSEALLVLALERVPLAHWRAIFIRLLRDLRNHRSGFPDLIHFPESGDYQWVEIKGPGDKLQKNQIRWMAYFAQHSIPHRTLNIRYADEG